MEFILKRDSCSAWGRLVIWVCDKADSERVHFDTRQYNTIEYTTADELKRQLQIRIEAVIGKGPGSAAGL
jgi:hypothetical protein